MPMPYGSRGGMAFSADELRVLRRALAHAIRSTSPTAPLGAFGPDGETDLQEYLRLDEAVDEAVREGGRLRAFLLADLARYRETLPGSAAGYLARLQEVLSADCVPGPDDLAALRALAGQPAGPAERDRRAALLRRCEQLAELSVRARLRVLPAARSADEPPRPAPRPTPRPGERKAPRPDRPIPTPGEVFPPRRKPAPPPAARTA
ncbi:hypothetical protein [Streptomyces sp. NPDC048644]|uniref:hypothetical protein n=1 Tax=Streptomyces sp. NPDC048644 TaxID=3365582 RepID=UPI003715611D